MRDFVSENRLMGVILRHSGRKFVRKVDYSASCKVVQANPLLSSIERRNFISDEYVYSLGLHVGLEPLTSQLFPDSALL